MNDKKLIKYINEKYPNIKVHTMQEKLTPILITSSSDSCLVCNKETNTQLSCKHYYCPRCINNRFERIKS